MFSDRFTDDDVLLEMANVLWDLDKKHGLHGDVESVLPTDDLLRESRADRAAFGLEQRRKFWTKQKLLNGTNTFCEPTYAEACAYLGLPYSFPVTENPPVVDGITLEP